MERPLRFGIFMAPFHPAGQNPTLALERDLELLVRLDELGYDEAWIGEHHSAGLEIIASPEVFIGVASQRTRHIRLGTGVVSLPYHHPLILADRMVLLDHLTRGRVMFGVGPGALPSDAYMMGIDPATQRERMEESLGAIMALLTSDEPVSMQTDWFTLREARLQLRPYTYPHFEIAVAATVSPAGPRTAGRYGVGLLSLGATSMGGFAVLGDHWKIWNDQAQAFGHSVDRSTWRLVGPMHVARTRKQAFEEVEYGIQEWIDYFRNVVALPLAPEEPDPRKWPQALVESGTAVIGTPDDAAAQLERLKKQSGGFGCFLIMANDWVERQASLASYELIAREVFPRFQGSADLAVRSREWCRQDHDSLIGGAMNAVVKEIERYEKETGYRAVVASLAQGQGRKDA
ncbi:MAG: LLM class flavin-dependent oxidoreductase [Thermodesulfobacteriota bacterium]|jgi:limonene 1,2-monooxygenase